MLGLLSDAVPRDQFPNAQFELYQMSNFQQPMEEGISLFLYRIAANTSRRNLPPTTGPDGRRFRPPIPVDLYYIATAWAPTAVRQQLRAGARDLQARRDGRDHSRFTHAPGPEQFLGRQQKQPATFSRLHRAHV